MELYGEEDRKINAGELKAMYSEVQISNGYH